MTADLIIRLFDLTSFFITFIFPLLTHPHPTPTHTEISLFDAIGSSDFIPSFLFCLFFDLICYADQPLDSKVSTHRNHEFSSLPFHLNHWNSNFIYFFLSHFISFISYPPVWDCVECVCVSRYHILWNAAM